MHLKGVHLIGVHLLDMYFIDVYIPDPPPHKQWCSGRFVEIRVGKSALRDKGPYMPPQTSLDRQAKPFLPR